MKAMAASGEVLIKGNNGKNENQPPLIKYQRGVATLIEVHITGEPKEIAALVLELQERRGDHTEEINVETLICRLQALPDRDSPAYVP